ncbi:MAG: phosphatase PAP2 family protein [Pseudomonadales bacterium]
MKPHGLQLICRQNSGHQLRLLCAFGLTLAAVRVFDLDRQMADLLYRLEGGAWSLRENPLLDLGLHRGGRWLVVGFGVAVLSLWLLTLCSTRFGSLRRPLGYLLASMSLSTLLIAAWKSVSADACPWSLARYGGDLSQSAAGDSVAGHCFPAGHAGAGFCLLGLYFLASRYAPSCRVPMLLVPLILGGVFGMAQQLRGAHFLSHDLWSALCCWLVAGLLARWLLDDRPSAQSASAGCPSTRRS